MMWQALIRQKVDEDFSLVMILVYGLIWLQNRQSRIRAAGGVPSMGAPMPKSVYDYEDNQTVLERISKLRKYRIPLNCGWSSPFIETW
jgi:hypothetical protein